MSLIAVTAIEAKQVTITPLSGSAWFLGLEQFGYAKVQGDSLIIYGKDGTEVHREALQEVHKIAVEKQQETQLKSVKANEEVIKILEDDYIHIRTHSVEFILR